MFWFLPYTELWTYYTEWSKSERGKHSRTFFEDGGYLPHILTVGWIWWISSGNLIEEEMYVAHVLIFECIRNTAWEISELIMEDRQIMQWTGVRIWISKNLRQENLSHDSNVTCLFQFTLKPREIQVKSGYWKGLKFYSLLYQFMISSYCIVMSTEK